MADTKISALTAATTPLAGSEVLPIVQSGTTKKVSIANLTSGRVVDAAGYTTTKTGVYTAIGQFFDDVSANTNYGDSILVYSNANSASYRIRLAPYRGGYADTMGWKLTTQSGGGTEVTALTVAPAGDATFVASTTATQFVPTGSGIPTNGMYLAAANTLAFATNSTNAVRIDSSQRMSLGGTLAVGRLNVVGSYGLHGYSGAIDNVSGTQNIATTNDTSGVVYIFGIQGGVGKSFAEVPYLNIGGTLTLGTVRTVVQATNPLTAYGTSGANITVTCYAANTYIKYYYTSMPAY